jgi:hypothetical protein
VHRLADASRGGKVTPSEHVNAVSKLRRDSDDLPQTQGFVCLRECSTS